MLRLESEDIVRAGVLIITVVSEMYLMGDPPFGSNKEFPMRN